MLKHLRPRASSRPAPRTSKLLNMEDFVGLGPPEPNKIKRVLASSLGEGKRKTTKKRGRPPGSRSQKAKHCHVDDEEHDFRNGGSFISDAEELDPNRLEYIMKGTPCLGNNGVPPESTHIIKLRWSCFLHGTTKEALQFPLQSGTPSPEAETETDERREEEMDNSNSDDGEHQVIDKALVEEQRRKEFEAVHNSCQSVLPIHGRAVLLTPPRVHDADYDDLNWYDPCESPGSAQFSPTPSEEPETAGQAAGQNSAGVVDNDEEMGVKRDVPSGSIAGVVDVAPPFPPVGDNGHGGEVASGFVPSPMSDVVGVNDDDEDNAAARRPRASNVAGIDHQVNFVVNRAPSGIRAAGFGVNGGGRPFMNPRPPIFMPRQPFNPHQQQRPYFRPYVDLDKVEDSDIYAIAGPSTRHHGNRLDERHAGAPEFRFESAPSRARGGFELVFPPPSENFWEDAPVVYNPDVECVGTVFNPSPRPKKKIKREKSKDKAGPRGDQASSSNDVEWCPLSDVDIADVLEKRVTTGPRNHGDQLNIGTPSYELPTKMAGFGGNELILLTSRVGKLPGGGGDTSEVSGIQRGQHGTLSHDPPSPPFGAVEGGNDVSCMDSTWAPVDSRVGTTAEPPVDDFDPPSPPMMDED